ncbi:hypothetical protein ABHI18_005642 [Aspergillus niger]
MLHDSDTRSFIAAGGHLQSLVTDPLSLSFMLELEYAFGPEPLMLAAYLQVIERLGLFQYCDYSRNSFWTGAITIVACSDTGDVMEIEP